MRWVSFQKKFREKQVFMVMVIIIIIIIIMVFIVRLLQIEHRCITKSMKKEIKIKC